MLLVSGRRTHQEGHASVFDAHPLCRLIAVTDERDIPNTRADLNRRLASDYGIPYIPDLDTALARDDVDIVSMCADVERRGRVGALCAQAGKHIYFDKPLAGSLEDVDAIVAAVERSGVRTQMYSLIEAPWVKAARQAIDSGRIGELVAVHGEFLFAKGRAGTVPEGTVRRERETVEKFTFVEAKREMFDMGVYAVGLVHILAGRRAESVFGLTGNYVFAEHARLDVEDFGALAIAMEGGVSATALGGRIGWMSHPKSGSVRAVLTGTDATLTFDSWRPRVEVYNDESDFTLPSIHPLDPMGMWGSTNKEAGVMPKRRWVTLDPEEAPMTYDVAAFIDCLERGREPEMNAKAAAPLVEVILAGYASATRGEPVPLPLPRG